jgi:hypothetical protein
MRYDDPNNRAETFVLTLQSFIRLLFLWWRCDPTRIMASSFLGFSRSHTTTHHSRLDSSGRVISSSQRPLPDNTQHSQQTNIHAPGGIRTYDLSRRAAADLRLWPRGRWDRPFIRLLMLIKIRPLKEGRYICRFAPLLSVPQFPFILSRHVSTIPK